MNFRRLNVISTIVFMLLDILSVYAAYGIAFLLRFNGLAKIPAYDRTAFLLLMPQSVVIAIIVFVLFRFYSTMWQFSGAHELIQILIGVTVSCAAITGAGYLIAPIYGVLRFPNSIYIIAWLILIAFVGVTRFSMRVIRKRFIKSKDRKSVGEPIRAMIIGASEIGSMAIKTMQASPRTNTIPIVAIDNNPVKKGTRIHGVKVVGDKSKIIETATRYQIDQIILALPATSKAERKEIIEICSKTSCEIKTVPSVDDITAGRATEDSIVDVDIADLLGRDEISLNTRGISDYIKDKTVLVTGAGGSIGSELCRQICKYNPKLLILLDIYENGAYDLQMELNRRNPTANILVLIGSVRDKARLNEIFSSFKIDVVFHAAAHKHVPLMELSPNEAIKNNVFGTFNVAEACKEHSVTKMVLISTDKAVNPTNIMGATKRICELIIQYFDTLECATEFVAVRFGNVLGSNGSVIPLFKKQILEGGPITVTHPDITRFFMTIPEAVELVLEAGAMAHGGEIFVLDMGKPVKIVDLAYNLIRLSGLEPDVDIKIEFTGLRPGEKLYEELLLESEGGVTKTSHELIYVGTPIAFDKSKFLANLDELNESLLLDDKVMISIVKRLVPNYTGDASKNDALNHNND